MASDLRKLLGWALTLFNFGVTAVVAWALALLIAAHSFQPQVARVEPFEPVGAFSSSLGFVGIPTAYIQAESLPAFAGSAAVTPNRAGSPFRAQ